MISLAPMAFALMPKLTSAEVTFGPVAVEHVAEASHEVYISHNELATTAGGNMDVWPTSASETNSSGGSGPILGFSSALNRQGVSELTVTLAPRNWSRRLEKEFQELADAEVLDTATLESHRRFLELQTMRRQLKNPRSAEEVLFELRREMMLADLVSALNRYAKFVNPQAIGRSKEVTVTSQAGA